MKDYRRIKPTTKVWTAIHASHPELVVYSTHSFEGDMFTSYGFRECDCPVMEVRTRWEIDPEDPYRQANTTHEFWLCSAIKGAA